MAKLLGLPVILVVDASAMARSAAAMVLGFRLFDRKTKVMGSLQPGSGNRASELSQEAMASLPTLDALAAYRSGTRSKFRSGTSA